MGKSKLYELGIGGLTKNKEFDGFEISGKRKYLNYYLKLENVKYDFLKLDQSHEDTKSFVWCSGNLGITRVDLENYDIERYENFWCEIDKTEVFKAHSCLFSLKNEVIIGLVEAENGNFLLRILSIEYENHRKEVKEIQMKELHNQGNFFYNF